MRDTTLKFIMQEKSPCDGCQHFAKCGSELMACKSFAFYVRTGRFNEDTPRNPSYTLYGRIFADDDEFNSLIREMYKEGRDGIN